MPALFVLFVILFAAVPYVLLFSVLLLPRILLPVQKIPRKYYLLADAGISVVTVVILTVISGKNPLNFTWVYLGDILKRLAMLLPLLGFALLEALIVNIALLFKDMFGDDPNFRFSPKRTAIAATAAAVIYVASIVTHVATLEIQVPEQYAQYFSDAELEEHKQMFIKHGRRDWRFPTSIEVVGAGEDWYAIEAHYFPFGMLGASSDGLYTS